MLCALWLPLACAEENTEPNQPQIDVIGPDAGSDTVQPDTTGPEPDAIVPPTFEMTACVVSNDENGETCSDELVVNLGSIPLGQDAMGVVRVINTGETVADITSLSFDTEWFEANAGLTIAMDRH